MAKRKSLIDRLFDSLDALIYRALVFAGSVAIVIGVYNLGLERSYRTDAGEIQGTVTGKVIATSRSQRGTTFYQYWVEYEYRDPGGDPHSGKDMVRRDRWDSLHKGSPILVFYLKSAPATSRLSNQTDWFRLIAPLVMGPPFAAIGMFALRRRRRRTKK